MNLPRLLASLLCLAALLPAESTAAEPPGAVVIIPIKTEISAAQFFFLRRALKEAEREQASAVVIDLETYGGEVKAAIDSMDALLKTRVPTFTYINPRAISAGALIALATRKIYMAPAAVIGAAAPVSSGGEDLPKTMTDKMVSSLSAISRAAAEQCGHRPELADCFIKKEAELKIGEVVIDRPDALLTLTAPEAARLYDGQPLLAAGVADSLDEMLKAAGLTGSRQTIAPSGFEQLAFWITAFAPLLLLGGIVGGYIEFKTPGFGLPGFISLLCFALFFAGHTIAGLTGWEVALVFSLGLLLVLGELLLHPGTVLPGVAGALLMVGSLLWAMVDHYPGMPLLPTSEMLARPVINLSIALVLAILAAWLLAKFLPRTNLYHRLVLERSVRGSPALATALSASPIRLGESGTASTVLRPAGKAEFAGKTVDVVTSGDFIEPGLPVRIVALDGLRVVVEKT